MKIYFASLFELSKKLEYNTVNICSILDYTQVPKDDSNQLNHERMRQLEETKKEEAPKLKLKPLLKGMKYLYLRDQ